MHDSDLPIQEYEIARLEIHWDMLYCFSLMASMCPYVLNVVAGEAMTLGSAMRIDEIYKRCVRRNLLQQTDETTRCWTQ